MSLSSPLNDDSESNQDRLKHTDSLLQPQHSYHRFLASLFAYSQAAYDSMQLPNYGTGYANEISALSTVFPGLYPFETINPTSFATRSPEKAEDPSSSDSNASEQDPGRPKKDNQSPDTAEAPSPSTPTSQADMFREAHDFIIEGRSVFNNIVIRCGNNSLVIVLVVTALICLIISLLIPGVYHPTPTSNPTTTVFPDFPPRVEIMSEGDIMRGLEGLKPFVSHGAINGSFLQDRNRQVHPGTRERVLSQIKAWIDNPNATKPMLWLHGPAGVGKSTIAQTITYSYTTERIPANFFFLHSNPERNDGNRLFTTIAWQFISSIPAIKRHIARSLIQQPDLPRKDVETQFQELIVRPFEALSNDKLPRQLSDMVVVIDGVDECVDVGLQERFLNAIGTVATKIPVPLRFLIISRPESHINDTVYRFEHHTLFIDLAEYAEADRDIEIYLKDKFADIAKRQSIDSTMWPGEKIIQELVHKASGQFIYASTVIGFVGDEDNDSAQSQLDIILGLKPRTTTRPFAELDRLYLEILER